MSGPPPSSTFDKFAWLRCVRGDQRLTDKEARLAVAVCVDYVRRDGTGWAVDLVELGDVLPQGMSHNRVKTALHKLVGFGYLVETGRTIGGRAVTARRSHNLSMPSLPAPAAVRVTDETRTSSGAGIGETRTRSGSNPHQQRFKPAPAAVNEVPSDQQKGPSLGTSIGTSYARAHAREGSRCTGIGCSVCSITRKAIDQCAECGDDARRPDGPDGAPGSDCPHHGNFRLHVKRRAVG